MTALLRVVVQGKPAAESSTSETTPLPQPLPSFAAPVEKEIHYGHVANGISECLGDSSERTVKSVSSFVLSPGTQRQTAFAILSSLYRRYKRRVRMIIILWEEEERGDGVKGLSSLSVDDSEAPGRNREAEECI